MHFYECAILKLKSEMTLLIAIESTPLYKSKNLYSCIMSYIGCNVNIIVREVMVTNIYSKA